MRSINEFKKTENFLSGKLLNAQLNYFRVFSIYLELNLLLQTDRGLESRYVSSTSIVSLLDGEGEHRDIPNILNNLHKLIGEYVTSVKLCEDGTLTLSFGGAALSFGSEEGMEILWSVTPNTPDVYCGEYDWAVILEEPKTLVMFQED